MLMPCGWLIKAEPGGAAAIFLRDLSVEASPMITLFEPIHVRYQVRLSSEKTISSRTWHSGTATALIRYGKRVKSRTCKMLFPSAVMYALVQLRLKKM